MDFEPAKRTSALSFKLSKTSKERLKTLNNIWFKKNNPRAIFGMH